MLNQPVFLEYVQFSDDRVPFYALPDSICILSSLENFLLIY